jgi:hypothetical protein
MDFRYLIESLLLELSGSEIYQKYYNKIPYDQFVLIVGADPQSNIEGNEKVLKMGKYSKLLLSMYQKGKLKLEDLEKANEYLSYVYKHNVPLDVNKVNELGNIYDLVKQYIVEDTQSLNKILSALSPDEYEKVFDGKDWVIYIPKTERASAYLGYETEWCTTFGSYSLNKKYKERHCYFEQYNRQGPLYIIINKTDPLQKFQFHFNSNQFMNRGDVRIDSSFFNLKDEIKYFFFPSLLKDVSKEEIQKEYKAISILPDEDQMNIMKKVIGKTDNRICAALLDMNVDLINQLIKDDLIEGEIRIYEGRLVLPIESLHKIYNLEQLDYTIHYYKSGSENSWDYINDSLDSDWGEGYLNDAFERLFKEYYENNSHKFSSVGINDYEKFKQVYYEDISNDREIVNNFLSDVTDLSTNSYDENSMQEAKSLEEYISFPYNEVSVNIGYFIKTLLKHNITNLHDDNGLPLQDVFEYFMNDYNLPVEAENPIDWETTTPKNLNETFYTIKSFDSYFDNKIGDMEGHNKCIKLRNDLKQIIEKFFNGNSTYYGEDRNFRLTIYPDKLNCENETVLITIYKKDAGTETGYVRVDNIVKYITNHSLFEGKLKLYSLI